MFTLLFRKMRKTKWMVLCLFIGFLMAAGMMSTVPIYMDASLQRMLIKDMESYQLGTGEFPGIYAVERALPMSTGTAEQLELIDTLPGTVKERVDYLPIPVKASKTVVFDNMLYLMQGGDAEIPDAKSKRKISGTGHAGSAYIPYSLCIIIPE